MLKNISNLGDAAIYCDFGKEVNKEINQKVIHYFNTLKNKKFPGITNMARSYNKLIVTFDLNITNLFLMLCKTCKGSIVEKSCIHHIPFL